MVPEPRAKSRAPIWLKVCAGLGAALLIAPFVVVRNYRMPSGSMIPTLAVGEHFTALPLLGAPARGDVIVFPYPNDPGKEFVKRVVAVPGDTVEMRDNALWLGGKPVGRRALGTVEYEDCNEATAGCSRKKAQAWEETLGDHTFTVYEDDGLPAQQYSPHEVPPGTLFVVGDNRHNSSDSRMWGFVPAKTVIGRVRWVWWSEAGIGARRIP